ncbi:MAG: tellurite resistance TerB family protein, partial [Hyphomicrobiaceae bacterium]
AYKAYQDYRSGQPVPAGAEPQRQLLQAAPDGSGFESAAMTDEHATLFIRAMIAAAAADGRIDEQEQQKILGGLKQAGLEKAAQQFLTRALKKPATAAQLAKAVSSPEEGVQVYTAARLAVDPDLEEEHAFLAALAERLGIDETLAAHIDATARSTGA